MRSRKPSLFQQAQKEIRRLEKATRRAEKRGYVFDLPFRKTREGKEKTRYTSKEVEKLKSLHLRDLYKYSSYGVVSGEEYYKQERKWQAQQAAASRWEKVRERIRKKEQFERERLLDEIHSYKSVSRTIIDNAMQRTNWLWNDKYYQKFLDVVTKAMEVNVNQTAQAFQDMINDGVLIVIQKHYKPQDYLIDFATFSSYFDDIVPEDVEYSKNDDPYDDDDDELIDDETLSDMSDEEREFFIKAFGGF